MKHSLIRYIGLFLATTLPLAAQRTPDAVIELTDEIRDPRIAVPEILGPTSSVTDPVEHFNNELWKALEASGRLEMVPRSFYPRSSPGKPEDIQRDETKMPEDPARRGFYLRGWEDVPVMARYLVYGRVEEVNGRLALSGYLADVTQESVEASYVFGKLYYSEPNVTGAREMAFEFARDILQNLGLGEGLAGSRIYYVHKEDGTDRKEIWAMDYDGRNKQRITNYRNLSLTPAISPDGRRIAFTTYVEGIPKIYLHSLATNRRLPFYNQEASMNSMPSFGLDGDSIYFASSASGRSQIYRGRHRRRQPAQDLVLSVARSPSVAQSEDRRGDRLRLRRDGHAANLRDEHQRCEPSAAVKRRRRRRAACVGPDGRTTGVRLDPRLRDRQLQHLPCGPG